MDLDERAQRTAEAYQVWNDHIDTCARCEPLNPVCREGFRVANAHANAAGSERRARQQAAREAEWEAMGGDEQD